MLGKLSNPLSIVPSLLFGNLKMIFGTWGNLYLIVQRWKGVEQVHPAGCAVASSCHRTSGPSDPAWWNRPHLPYQPWTRSMGQKDLVGRGGGRPSPSKHRQAPQRSATTLAASTISIWKKGWKYAMFHHCYARRIEFHHLKENKSTCTSSLFQQHTRSPTEKLHASYRATTLILPLYTTATWIL